MRSVMASMSFWRTWHRPSACLAGVRGTWRSAQGAQKISTGRRRCVEARRGSACPRPARRRAPARAPAPSPRPSICSAEKPRVEQIAASVSVSARLAGARRVDRQHDRPASPVEQPRQIRRRPGKNEAVWPSLPMPSTTTSSGQRQRCRAASSAAPRPPRRVAAGDRAARNARPPPGPAAGWPSTSRRWSAARSRRHEALVDQRDGHLAPSRSSRLRQRLRRTAPASCRRRRRATPCRASAIACGKRCRRRRRPAPRPARRGRRSRASVAHRHALSRSRARCGRRARSARSTADGPQVPAV